MSDDAWRVIGLAGALVMGLCFGLLVNDEIWKRDCSLIHKHVSNGKVYECREEAK